VWINKKFVIDMLLKQRPQINTGRVFK
jgi:hypothetical protein